MTNEIIIQHHEPVDFISFYENVRSGYIGIDYMDFENFMRNEGEKHSFVASADSSDRINSALMAIKAEGMDAINKATSLLMTIVRSPNSERPILVDEVSHITDFISGLPDNCEVCWGIADDASLGDEIKIYLLVNI